MTKENIERYVLKATVIEAKGQCDAKHKLGDKFELDNMKTDGLCGGFYHDIYPSICTYLFGGKLPWFEGDSFFVKCPDPANQITMRITREKIN